MPDDLATRRKRGAPSKRAALRRRSLEDYEIPGTRGPESKMASLLMTGMPAGAGAKTAARFGPKGFKLAKKGAESVGKYVMRVIKPIITKGVKKGG